MNNSNTFDAVVSFLTDRTKFSDPANWFQFEAPKVSHILENKGLSLDCRYKSLRNQSFNEKPYWFDCVFDHSDFSYSIFNEKLFQGSTVFFSNFSYAQFKYTQMCPFYAHAADFSGCTFDTCLAFGNSAIKEPYGYYNDFSECSFNHVSANDSSFHTCDFRKADLSNSRFINCDLSYSLFNGANLTQAYFEQCTFTDGYAEVRDIRCDFRGCNLEGVQFVACDFLHAKFDDTPQARAVVATGDNLNCDTIVWGM